MTSRFLEILTTGPGLTVQDRGRPGFQKYAVVRSGAMDRMALEAGRLLLDNPPDAAVLELSGAALRFKVCGGPARIALSGAPATAICDGHRLRWPGSFALVEESIVTVSPPAMGNYSYVHIDGGIRTEPVLGSRSTHVRSGLGGLDGRFLRDGDLLPLAPASDGIANLCLPEQDYFKTDSIRIVSGANAELYSENEWRRFLDSTFTITAQKDRMGARLSSDPPALPTDRGLSGISDAVVRGDIQVDGNGAATVLLADHQPTGGYPRIATIITADFECFAQLPADARFQFRLISQEEALAALKTRQDERNALASQILPVRIDPASRHDLLSFNLVGGVVSSDDDTSWKGYL
ncbi:MAG: biotin-dependent carboxyltransferase family protein [Alphaproteobacteria bacterium]|nr:biotin-dependent carboxyltransferase family protein [Alphaproteobacteria bacterium]